MGNRLIFTIRGIGPKVVPETENSPFSVTTATRTRLAYSSLLAAFASTTLTPRSSATIRAFTRLTSSV